MCDGADSASLFSTVCAGSDNCVIDHIAVNIQRKVIPSIAKVDSGNVLK